MDGKPAHGLGCCIIGRPVLEHAPLSETAVGLIDQAGMVFLEHACSPRPSDPWSRDGSFRSRCRTWPPAAQQIFAFRSADIDGNVILVVVHVGESRRNVLPEETPGGDVAHEIPDSGKFDLDDFSTKIGQQVSGYRAKHSRAQFQNPDTLQCFGLVKDLGTEKSSAVHSK